MKLQEVESRADFILDSFNSEIIHALRKATLPTLQKYIIEEDRVVEIAAGSGRFSRVFPEVTNEIVFLDRNPDSLSTFHGTERAARLLQADTKYLPFRNNSVDVFVGLSPYEVITRDSLQEMQRALKPGGRILAFQDNGLTTPSSDIETQRREMEFGITKANMARKHQIIIEDASQLGFKVLDGYASREAFFMGDLNEYLASLSEDDLKRTKSLVAQGGGGYLLGFVKAFGSIDLMNAEPGGEKSLLRFVAKSYEISWPRGMHLTSGKDYIEYIKIRYLVLQKQ